MPVRSYRYTKTESKSRTDKGKAYNNNLISEPVRKLYKTKDDVDHGVVIDKTLRNNPRATVYLSNVKCTKTETRPIGCTTDNIWTPKPETKCKGVRFEQHDKCWNKRYATGTKDCNPNYCKIHPTAADCISDDPTDPNDDDPTDPGCEDKDNDGLCDVPGVPDKLGGDVVKPTKLTTGWSKSPVGPWNDFDKLALLKSKKDKIYIRTTPEGGGCPLDAPFPFFEFMKVKGKEGTWMKPADRIYREGASFIMPIQPNNNAKTGIVFTQPMNLSYCDFRDPKPKELKVKIVNIVQKEI